MPIFHTIDPADVWLGDHLYIRSSPFHQHHGIVIFVAVNNPDESQVLEFNTHDGSHNKTCARIQVVILAHFRRNHTLKCVVYGSEWARWKRTGTAYLPQALAPETVVDNARLILEQIEFGGGLVLPNDPEALRTDDEGHGYNLILRNCECLAFWCKTGRWYSDQVIALVENVSKSVLGLMRGIVDFLAREGFIPSIEQEAFRLEIQLH